MVLESKSPEDTFQIGMRLGQLAKAGEVYTLTGDLGEIGRAHV